MGSTLPSLHLLLASLLALLAGGWDLRCRRIPNRLTYPGVVGGLCLGLLPTLEPSPLSALGGLALGLLLPLGLFLGGALGGGDVKLLAAAGALLGFPLILDVLFLAVCAGALLGLLGLLRHRRLGELGAAQGWLLAMPWHRSRGFPPVGGPLRIPLGLAIAAAILATLWVPALRVTPAAWLAGG